MKYKNIGAHAEDTAEGAMVPVGELTSSNFDPENEHNKRLIEEGVFIPVGDDVEPNATDDALALANEKGIEITAVTGTGADGRVTKRDVERYAAETGSHEEETN